MGVETIAIGIAATVGVLLVFMGLSGGHNASARLGRYVARETAETTPEARAGLGERISTSGALTSINRIVEGRDWGTNMARELARADLVLKPSEFLAIRAGAIVGIPLVMIVLSPFIDLFANPLLWLVGLGVGWWLPRFWLNRRKGKRLKAFNSNLADTIVRWPNAARRLIVPAGHRHGRARRNRPSRPSSGASSVRSTLALRSTSGPVTRRVLH
jgi:tight adherence protein B